MVEDFQKGITSMQVNINWKDSRNPIPQVRKKGPVVYLSYPGLEETGIVRHGFSTRIGGVSEGIYESMNLSFARGDDEKAVWENYKRIAEAVGFDLKSVVTSDQTHTTNVRVVTEKDRGRGLMKPREYQDVDGMVTNVPGITLVTFYADCVPLYLVDPVQKAIGLVHSGWRGTVGKIGLEAVRVMEREYGTDPRHVIAAIGPSICQDCYEVSGDVIEKFQKSFPEEQWEQLFYPKPGGKYQLNLWEANRLTFLEAGLEPEKIFLPGLCTCCNSQFLFSHRASKGRRGNLAAFLVLK